MTRHAFEAFAALGLTEGLGERERHLVEQYARITSLAPGQTLFAQGEESTAVGCVVEGVLSALVPTEGGSETVVGTLGAGEPVGELQILTGGRRTASVRAETAAQVALLPRDLFVDPRNADLAGNLDRIIRERLRHYRLAAVLPRLFGDVDEKVMAEVERFGAWRRLSRGEFLCRAGETDRSLYVVVSGRLIVATRTADGSQRLVGEIAAGESVGEMALFTGEARSADVVAIRNTELIEFPEPAFRDLLSRHPSIGMGITRIIINRLRQAVTSGGAHRGIRNLCLLPISTSISIREVAEELTAAASNYCSVFSLDARSVDENLATPGIANVAPDDPAHMRLDAYFTELDSRHDIVIFCADGEDTAWTRRCLQQADTVLLLADARGDPAPGPFERQLAESTSLASPGRTLVLFHPGEAVVPTGTAAWLADRSVSSCLHVKNGDSAGYRRLARIVTGNAVGVVLSGGGAKGYAHAGVLRALEEAGIEVDMVGGTSIGSVIAGGYAMGLSPDQIISQNADLFRRHDPFHEYTLPVISLLASRRLDALFREAFGEVQIEDLWRGYFCVSSNLTTAEERVHTGGSLWQASRASMSLPGVIVPVVEGRDLLVDGGVVNNLPADIMKTMCNGTVITVDVAPRREIELGEGEDSFPSPWQVLGARLNPFRKRLHPPNILQILGRSTMLASMHHLQDVVAESRYHLAPPVGRFGMLETDKADEIAAVGYEYAREIVRSWEELKRPTA